MLRMMMSQDNVDIYLRLLSDIGLAKSVLISGYGT